MTLQDRQRARIQRIAAEFVTGKGRAIEEADARAGAREDDRRERTRGAGAGNRDVIRG